MSLEEALILTWSFGWTGFLLPIFPPRISIALLEITSLAFMFDCVPEPSLPNHKGEVVDKLQGSSFGRSLLNGMANLWIC